MTSAFNLASVALLICVGICSVAAIDVVVNAGRPPANRAFRVAGAILLTAIGVGLVVVVGVAIGWLLPGIVAS